VLSFGTAGCNLACKFCQNWDISKSREIDTLADAASPGKIALVAKELNCNSVAFTYNDPIVFMEYAIDVARACHAKNIKTVAVSSGYMCAEPRKEFYNYIDAANIDLKAFTDDFYHKITGSHLQPVLDTLLYLKHETNVWIELTTLIIPDKNDSEKELKEMTKWVVENLGPDVPMHFTAFHPDWKMMDVPATPLATLIKARKIAIDNGVHYAYTGNVDYKLGENTYCHACGLRLIARDRYKLTEWKLDDSGSCIKCGAACAGVFDKKPGNWGNKRLPIQLSHYASSIATS
jgi:pyruvate formate lyase activating enzyme